MEEVKEVARYLGITKNIPTQTYQTIQQMLSVAKQIKPQHRLAFFDIKKQNGGIALANTDIVLQGELATKHFDKCHKIIVVLATMGMESEIKLQEYFAQNSQNAVVFDACLTQQIENYLDNLEQTLLKNTAEKSAKLTYRISCGYGDLALSHQKELLQQLQDNKIGVYINDSYMLSPNKSVIALIGVYYDNY